MTAVNDVLTQFKTMEAALENVGTTYKSYNDSREKARVEIEKLKVMLNGIDTSTLLDTQSS